MSEGQGTLVPDWLRAAADGFTAVQVPVIVHGAGLGWVGLAWVLAKKADDAWHVGVNSGACSPAGQLISPRNEKAVVTK